MATFDELHRKAHNRLNLRKAQRSIGLIARKRDLEEVDFREFDPGELPDFREMGFQYAGRITTDGWTFGREEETDEAESHGFPEPGRIDTESVTRTISTTVQETFRRVIREITKGADYSGITFSPNGFLVLPEPDFPDHEEWSLITIFRDGPPARQIVFGRHFGTVKLSSAGDETFGGEGVLQQELTWRVFSDDETGTPFEEFYGGPGFTDLAADLGYESASGGSGDE